ncbi:MAG TPA: phosphatase PAP2 family protein, partial [Anaerolineae bacterium]
MVIVTHRLPAGVPFAQFISALGSINVVLPLWAVVVTALAARRQAAAFWWFLPAPLGYPLYILIKAVVSRASPVESLFPRVDDAPLGYYFEEWFRNRLQTMPPEGVSLPAIQQPVTAPAVVRVFESGYPSGHALLALILYGGLALWFWYALPVGKWRWLVSGIALALAVSIGLVRVYMGLHYPSDILGSWLLGILFVFVSRRMGATIAQKYRVPQRVNGITMRR